MLSLTLDRSIPPQTRLTHAIVPHATVEPAFKVRVGLVLFPKLLPQSFTAAHVISAVYRGNRFGFGLDSFGHQVLPEPFLLLDHFNELFPQFLVAVLQHVASLILQL